MKEKINIIEERNSNFELLRIISMIMIFIYHYCEHGGILAVGSYTTNKLVALFLFIFGRVGVNLFIILSGYFLVNSKFKIKKIIKLILQVLFYSIFMKLISNYQMKISFKIKDFYVYFSPIFYGIYWFVTCYVVMYLISPFYNKMIKSLSKKDCKKTIIIGLLILGIFPSLHMKNNFIASEIIWYIFMYFVGASINIHKFSFKNYKTEKIIMIIYPFIAYILIIVIILINKHFKLNLDQYYFCGLNSIIGFIETIGIFMFFKNLKLKNNKFINSLAKISFATYLISDHSSYVNIFWHINLKTLEFAQKPVVIFLLHILLCIIITWGVAILIELIRVNIFEKNIFKIKVFDKYFEKIDKFMNS